MVLLGIGLGFNGGLCPNSVPSPFEQGWKLGAESREEAEDHRKKKSDAGLHSVEARKLKNGTAQPRTFAEQCSNSVREVFEPIPNPQSLNYNPQTTNQCALLHFENVIELPNIKKTPKEGKTKKIGTFPEEFEEAWTLWVDFHKWMRTEGKSRCKESHVRCSENAGGRNQAFTAWTKHIGSVTNDGAVVDHSMMLDAVVKTANARRAALENSSFCTARMLSTEINDPMFIDRLLEISNVARD